MRQLLYSGTDLTNRILSEREKWPNIDTVETAAFERICYYRKLSDAA